MSKEMMSLKDREYNFFSDGEAIQKVCAHVSMGGSLIDLAETLGINYFAAGL